jgi:hypothetical protein
MGPETQIEQPEFWIFFFRNEREDPVSDKWMREQGLCRSAGLELFFPGYASVEDVDNVERVCSLLSPSILSSPWSLEAGEQFARKWIERQALGPAPGLPPWADDPVALAWHCHRCGSTLHLLIPMLDPEKYGLVRQRTLSVALGTLAPVMVDVEGDLVVEVLECARLRQPSWDSVSPLMYRVDGGSWRSYGAGQDPLPSRVHLIEFSDDEDRDVLPAEPVEPFVPPPAFVEQWEHHVENKVRVQTLTLTLSPAHHPHTRLPQLVK